MRALSTFLPLAFLLTSLAGCASDIAPRGAATAEPYVYKLGPDDKLRVTVYGEAALSGEYSVNADGDVSLALAGPVHASGMTMTDFIAAVTQAYGKTYLKDPKVAVDLLDYRPVYVLGEVNHAGAFPYQSGMTVLGAVATAGGFTYRANLKEVMVRHPGEAGEARLPLSADLVVRPGDTIRIRERYV